MPVADFHVESVAKRLDPVEIRDADGLSDPVSKRGLRFRGTGCGAGGQEASDHQDGQGEANFSFHTFLQICERLVFGERT